MTFHTELRSGSWTWRTTRPASPGRAGFADVQLWHDDLPQPLLDVTGGAWVLDAPGFAADGTELQCDVVALASRARFRVTFELAAGRWRSAGEPRGQPVAVFQQRFGTGAAVAPWPVVSIGPVEPAVPADNEAANEAANATTPAPATSALVPSEKTPATESAPSATPAAALAEDVLPAPAVTRDGRWRFEFAWAPVHERDASGRLRSYCHFVLHDTRTAVAFDSRSTGDLCWPAGRWLRLVRGPGAPVWFLVDVERAVFWLENFREPLGPERPLDELVGALTRR